MKFSKALSVISLFMACFVAISDAFEFHVGGQEGWVTRPKVEYNKWAQRLRFQINDTLVFRYKKGDDSVLLVNKDDYDNCSTKGPIETMTDGVSVFKFPNSGPYYFISGNPEHCREGQKLTVVVLATSGKKTPSGGPASAPRHAVVPPSHGQPPAAKSPSPAPTGSAVPSPATPGSGSPTGQPPSQTPVAPSNSPPAASPTNRPSTPGPSTLPANPPLTPGALPPSSHGSTPATSPAPTTTSPAPSTGTPSSAPPSGSQSPTVSSPAPSLVPSLPPSTSPSSTSTPPIPSTTPSASPTASPSPTSTPPSPPGATPPSGSPPAPSQQTSPSGNTTQSGNQTAQAPAGSSATVTDSSVFILVASALFSWLLVGAIF